jgi:endothelin-converting enzyme
LTKRSRTLTTIEKALAVAALLFLLLSATFIGLFAGTAGQLKKARNKPAETVTRIASGSHPSATVTATTTVSGPIATGKPGKDSGICLTKECVTLASELLQTIDTTIDPCEDFYLFASESSSAPFLLLKGSYSPFCSISDGGWLNSHSIPSDRGSLGSFQVLQDSNRKIIRDVLEAPNEKPSKDDSPVEQAEKENLVKLRLGYKTCMDEVSWLGSACSRDVTDECDILESLASDQQEGC